MIRNLCLVLAALCSVTAAPSSAQLPRVVTYEVQAGDTLLQIAQRYLRGANVVKKLQRANGIANPRRMPIGKMLKIDRSLLKFQDVKLEVLEFSGQVLIANSPAARNLVLREGQTVATRANGYVTFSTEYGGRISLPSNSRARLVRARRYILGNALDVNFQIENGRGSASSPKLQGDDQLLLTTPRAVTAVRGTNFRVAFDDVAERSITEVTEGTVEVAAGKDRIEAAQGFGVATSDTGLAEPEALLPAPKLIDPAKIQTDEQVRFRLDPVAGATAYRVQVARDAGFLDILSGVVIDGEEAVFTNLSNGTYFARARAISASGIEGFSTEEVERFRRKRFGVDASTGPSDLIDGFVFKWVAEGDPKATFAFQLWQTNDEGSDPASLMIDEAGLTITEMVLTDLAPGRYSWRVAAVQAEADGLLKVWGPTQKLKISE